jgi:hypothetical protein
MIPGFEALVEQRIKKAQQEGAFDNLEGQGKPLKFDDQNVPEDLRLAHKILKNAGFLPPEVALRKKVFQVEQLLAETQNDSPERSKIQKKLNFLLTKLGTTRGGNHSFPVMTDEYRETIIKKLS